jgi:predicted CXXCH cytochrome family protein
MRRYLLWALLSALLQAACSPELYRAPERPNPPNPHSLCITCHTTAEPKAGPHLFAEGVDPSSICLSCHQYRDNHHPVNFAPANPSTFPLPLFSGKVRCLTCHEIHGGPQNKGTTKLLRGGPYPDRRTICFKCHYPEQYSEINPHNMLNSDGTIKEVRGEPICLMCHAVLPNPAVDITGSVRFKADVGFLCWRCHPPMPGSFFKQHFLVTPSTETLKNMQDTEERLLVILPLVPRGRITCSTCHNPHQAGVIVHEAAAKGADRPSRLRLPSICFACHKM